CASVTGSVTHWCVWRAYALSASGEVLRPHRPEVCAPDAEEYSIPHGSCIPRIGHARPSRLAPNRTQVPDRCDRCARSVDAGAYGPRFAHLCLAWATVGCGQRRVLGLVAAARAHWRDVAVRADDGGACLRRDAAADGVSVFRGTYASATPVCCPAG